MQNSTFCLNPNGLVVTINNPFLDNGQNNQGNIEALGITSPPHFG